MSKQSLSEARRIRIRKALLDRGTSFAEIARELGVQCSSVSRVAAGARVSQRVRRALALATGIPYPALWGEPNA